MGIYVKGFLSSFTVIAFALGAHAAMWQDNGGNMIAVGDVSTNAGFIGYRSITVGAGNSANFNQNGQNVDGLRLAASDSINIFGDFLHNAGFVQNASGGLGMLGDDSLIGTRVLNIGGGFVMGDGMNSYKLTLDIENISAGSITTNTGSRLAINSDFSGAPEMAIGGAAVFADGIYMGANSAGTESVNIISGSRGDTYTITAGDFAVDGFVNVEDGRLVINSDTNISITGDVGGNLGLNADSIYIGGNLRQGVDLLAGDVSVGGDVAGGVRIAPNGVGAGGFHTSFNRINIDVGGVYYFDNDSFLQLVLNQSVADSDGNPEYDANLDDALIHVGGFDAGGVTIRPDIENMLSTPNIEILVDGIMQELRKIKLMASDTVITDIGALNLAGVWLYDPSHKTRLFQESGIVISDDGKSIFLNIATMRSLADMVAHAPPYAGPTDNDMSMALALDDLIRHRLGGGDIDGHYSSLMRLIFPKGDAYNKMMVNGGAHDDALSVMTADGIGYETDQTYVRAVNYVRQFALDDVAAASRTLGISGRIARNSLSDHLMDDFVWQRYHDKGFGWADMTFTAPDGGGSVVSFAGGADWKFGRSVVLGANLGYNQLNLNSMTGGTLAVGAYGTAEVADWARAYGTAGLSFHSLTLSEDSPLTGAVAADISSTDATAQLGLLHRLFGTYLNGRAYVDFGYLGGYTMDKKTSAGASFMDIKYGDSFVLTPGYELSLGKDIFMGMWAFARPSLKFGIEYDLVVRESDFQFKFSESPVFRDWKGDGPDSRVWLKYGADVEFAIAAGANLRAGYEVMKNGVFKAASVKISGSLRF